MTGVGRDGDGAGNEERGRDERDTGEPRDTREPRVPLPRRGDRRLYFVLMTVCIGLFVVAWAVVRRYSVVAAVVMSAVALVIPPFAAIVANGASSATRRRP